jgi:hypothetical protein
VTGGIVSDKYKIEGGNKNGAYSALNIV